MGFRSQTTVPDAAMYSLLIFRHDNGIFTVSFHQRPVDAAEK